VKVLGHDRLLATRVPFARHPSGTQAAFRAGVDGLDAWHAVCSSPGATWFNVAERQEDTMSAGNQSSGRETTIVDNEVYNLIATLATKLQGLAAYDKYQQDGQANDPIWQELRQQDTQAVARLMGQLEQFAQQGRLRAQ
jgi:hypothetical protein